MFWVGDWLDLDSDKCQRGGEQSVNLEVGKSEPLHIAGEDVEASLEIPQQVKHTVTI